MGGHGLAMAAAIPVRVEQAAAMSRTGREAVAHTKPITRRLTFFRPARSRKNRMEWQGEE